MTIRVQQEADRVFSTVHAIAGSPQVHQFRIGITATPERRRYMYRVAEALRYPHFVILGPSMKRASCLNLERELQARAKADALTYAKYDSSVRDRSHSRSVGGSDHYEDYFVYMSWR